ncbi:MAG: PBP1A family penicillin-binding protein [Syntrophomonadaceae bacterium]|nr:PBP1A family penicillin-binding protein [Syntrophomonadaceae bacterium]
MRRFSRTSLIMTGLLLFMFSFLLGIVLTESTPRLLLLATGINNWEYQPRGQSVLISSDGQVLEHLGYKRVFSEEFPVFLKQAVVAVEDRRFYEHGSVDSRGIVRAVLNNLKAGNKEEGGSTITQQLARTLFLNQEKTYTRKMKEALIATAIEEKFSKDTILNMYLNEIYMGRRSSGIATAARFYFGKDVSALNQAEICILVGMIQAPEYYSPDRNFAGLKARQEIVISVLQEQSLLNPEQAEAIAKQPVYIKGYEPVKQNYPYIEAYLTPQLEKILGPNGLYQGGIKIYLTIDSRMQKAAERAVKNHVQSFAYRGITASDAALISIDPASGGIKAMVGGVDYARNQINMAVWPRQPGSAIKPLYYAAAINEGIITPDTQLNNKERDFGGYKPKNYAWAPEKTTVKQALVNSYNIASLEILNRLGIEEACQYLESFGISSLTDADKTLALGLGGMSKGISPLQMASAFAVFANNGIYNDYYCIDRIEDPAGRTIYMNESSSQRVISNDTALLMDEMLKDVVRYGTGRTAAIAIKSGGKTGTTNDSRDLWYLGYTADLATAIWVGNSDGQAVSGYASYGGSVSAPVWRDYMNSLFYSYILKDKPQPKYTQEQEKPVDDGLTTKEQDETVPEVQEDDKLSPVEELPPDSTETSPDFQEQTPTLPAPDEKPGDQENISI